MAEMRNELKFFISPAHHALLSSRLSSVLVPDFHMNCRSCYNVRSLYFDDPSSSAYLDKISGVENRSKYRIRFYNGDLSYIRLEKKEKIGKMSRKTVECILEDQALELISGKTFPLDCPGLLGEFYSKMRYEGFRPLIFVDYQRRAFCYPAGNVRITLDSCLKGSLFQKSLLGEEPFFSVPMLTDYILEVKFDSFLPPHISQLLEDIPKVSSAISKFCLVRESII